MKNILKFSLALNVLLGISLLYSYTKSSVISKCESVCLDNKEPQLINARLLKEMAELYQTTRCTVPNTNDPDAVSVWFSLESIENLIYAMKSNRCKNNCNDDTLGLRIYYARYPQIVFNDETPRYYNDLKGLDKSYSLKHTVFMVPSYKGSDSIIDYDINTCDSRLNPDFHTLDNTIMAVFPRGKNHGTLCPPICEGYSAFCESCNGR